MAAQSKIVSIAQALGIPASELDRSVVGAPLFDLVLRMDAHGNDREAPVRELMARLGDRWSTLILLVLSTGTFRHATVRRLISALSSEQAISQRMLTLRLRALERDGLVLRVTAATVPPKVDYALSPLGGEFVALIEQLLAWIERHDSEIRASREKFGAEGE